MQNRIMRIGRLLPVTLLLLLMLSSLGGQAALAQDVEPAAGDHLAAIAPALERQLSEGHSPISFLVVLDEQPDPDGYLARAGLRSAERTAKGEAIYRYLTDFARTRQASLRAWLDERGITYRAFYIVNAIEIKGDASLVMSLRARSDVDRLAANPEVRLSLADTPPVADSLARTAVLPPIPPYGILYADAPAVWALGYQGAGIVVASQDTGVDWTHPALHEQYRGWDSGNQTVTHPYNWYDYWGTASRQNCDPDPQVPCDDFGHGTHTVGTMLGEEPSSSKIVGMAPDAQWIGCRNMEKGRGTPASYMACFEFFLAPFPQNGDPQTDGIPSKAPHIINNSWYCPPSEGCDFNSLRQVVQTVRAAGQFVVVSAGNDGPGCSSVRYPITAYPEVFSVGAYGEAKTITGFSSRGPVTVDGSGRLKPQIIAAGENVLSTIPGGGYGINRGTSMSSPHVAGAVALLWSAAPNLVGQVDETEQILIKSATPVLNNGCDEGPTPVSPNNTYGYGRLNVLAAVTMAQHPGVVTVTVGGVVGPLVGVTVTLTDTRTGAVRTGVSNDEGQVVFSRVYVGDYEASALWGSISDSMTIGIQEDEQTDVVLALTTVYYFPLLVGREATELP